MEKSNENIIEWLTGDKSVELTLNQTGWINKAKKLKEQHPDEVFLYENTDGSVFAIVPLSWVKIMPKREVSEEERRRRANQLIRNILKADNNREDRW